MFLSTDLDRRGSEIDKEKYQMMNLVEKYTSEAAEATDDDGVVAIEYVLVAGLVAVGVAITFGTGLWNTMLAELNGLFA